MPIICTSVHEKLTARFANDPSPMVGMLAGYWEQIAALHATAHGTQLKAWDEQWQETLLHAVTLGLPPEALAGLEAFWGQLQAQLSAPLSRELATFDTTLKGLLEPPDEEGAAVFYHRLTKPERLQLNSELVQRGQTEELAYFCRAAELAVDGWEGQVLDAALRPVPVPPPGPGQRAALAAIVQSFPVDDQVQLGRLACARINEELKKSWMMRLPGTLPSWTATPGTSSPASTAVPSMPDAPVPHPVTPEGLTPVGIGS